MQIDILHPLAHPLNIRWRECTKFPVGMSHAQAVWLGCKLYVGGGHTTSIKDATRLYIYTPTTDTWRVIKTVNNKFSVYYFALVIYHSQVVLVGGVEYVGEKSIGPASNKLWTLTEHDEWREGIPPMTLKRQCASAVEFADNIFIAGGVDNGRCIEVYNGHHWAVVRNLLKPCRWPKSAVLNGHWYLMGGYGQGEEIYYASLDLLVASSKPSGTLLPSVWKRLPDVPDELSSAAVFGNRLIAVGGGHSPCSSSIHAWSPYNQSWVHVGDMPVGLHSTCTAILPTGELMVIGGVSDSSTEVSYMHKASLKSNGNCE